MKIKLLLDEDVHLAVAVALRKRGYDVAHVQELDRKGKTDPDQLRYAVEQKRCMVSFNMSHYADRYKSSLKNVSESLSYVTRRRRA